MDWNKLLYPTDEKPLDKLVEGYSRASIFRTVGFIGDSLSSGEFETRDGEGKAHYHDLYDYSWGQFIARKNGLKAYNFSKGGMTAKVYMESFAESRGFWDKDKACQAYVIALGVNDLYNKKWELGSTRDIDVADWRNNAETFAVTCTEDTLCRHCHYLRPWGEIVCKNFCFHNSIVLFVN